MLSLVILPLDSLSLFLADSLPDQPEIDALFLAFPSRSVKC